MNHKKSTTSLIGIFNSPKGAEKTVNDIIGLLGNRAKISMLDNGAGKKNTKSNVDFRTGIDKLSGGPGVTAGSTLGGLTGAALALQLGGLAATGIGSLAVAGSLAGLISGALTGGVAGALLEWQLAGKEGKENEEEPAQNKILIHVEVDKKDAATVRSIFRYNGALKFKELKLN